jgi:hypothetical protein
MYSNTSAELSIGTNAAAKLGQATLYVGGDISASGNMNIVGGVTSSFTGSFVGDGSGLTSIPTPSGTVSGSAQFNTLTLPFTGSFTGSFAGDGSGLTSLPTQTANDFTTTLKNKLDAIEASADVTDATNVTSAGALMDSELTSIANVKALDQSVVSGASPTFGTANLTDATNKRLMTDAQETKLDSVESSADVTDATNVTAAGALMDSEVTNLSLVKGLASGISNGNVLVANAAVADNDFLKIAGTSVEGRTVAEVLSDLNVEAGADVTDAANVLANLPAGVVSSSAFPLGVNITGGAIITGSTSIYRSGSIGDTTVFTIEGGLGTLFSVTDELTGSLFSVNDISGIPMFEVFSYEQIKMGTFGAEGLRVSGSDAQTSGSLAVGPIVNSGVAGRIDASNDVVAFSTSDRRWKDNITPIESPLQKLLELGGYEFDWREDKKVHGNKGHDVGVIAQEVEAVLPEAVQTRSSGMKAVRYEKIIPLLIETIKEQQKQIDELKNRIK